MNADTTARRLSRLPRITRLGLNLPLAVDARSRLLGLALLDREHAGTGLVIPRCRSVHSYGMRFSLRVIFIDAQGRPLLELAELPPRRLASHRRADAVIELPI